MTYAEAPFGAGPLSEGGGDSIARLYYVIGPSAGWSDPTADEVRAGTLAGGATATASSNELAPTTTQAYDFAPATLPDGSYRVAFVWALGAGESNVAVSDVYSISARKRDAGKSRKRRRKQIIEIDGKDMVVESEEAAVELLEQVKEGARQTAELAVSRAAAATRRPANKVYKDARKTLEIPEIRAPGMEAEVERVLGEIRSMYDDAMQTIEISTLLRAREREEEDDEDVLLLIA